MTQATPQTIDEQRRLVQRILGGGIPSGREFDECRAALAAQSDTKTCFNALFTLLQGALADPFFPIDETERVVPIIRDLARGEIEAKDLL